GVVGSPETAAAAAADTLAPRNDTPTTRGRSPASPDKTDQYVKALQASGPQQMADVSLSHLKAEIALAQAESAPQKPVEVKNDVPKIYFNAGPAVLVQVDGQPVLRQVPGFELFRVINTYAVLLFDQAQGTYYLHVVGRWAAAQSLDGPWAESSPHPASLGPILRTVTKGGQVNALDDPGEYVTRLAADGVFPTIYVSTVPAELIMTRGAPSYEPISGTSLLDVT